MKKRLLVLPALMAGAQLLAQDSAFNKQLDDVIVTANKTSQKQSTTGKIVTVISREQLERNTGRTVAQILNEQAGVIVNGAQNPLGTNQTLFLRGAGAANTLILIDGVPVNDPSGSSQEFNLNHLNADQIERIEILKGAQSTLYGSDAVAGVINIISRKQVSQRPIGFNSTVAAGSYGTWKGNVGVSGKTDIAQYNLQYTRWQSDGFSAAYDSTHNSGFDKDGFEQDVLSLSTNLQINDHWKWNVFSQYSNYRSDIDDDALLDDKNNTIKNQNLLVGISSVYTLPAGSITVNLQNNNIYRKYNDPVNDPAGPNDYDPFKGRYEGESLFAEAYGNFNLHKHLSLLAGVDYRRHEATIDVNGQKISSDSLKANQLSGYLSLMLRSLKGFSAELGSRFTHHSVFGNNVTFSFNPSYLISDQVKIFANVATGFRAPSLYNLASEYGNRNLEPEESFTWEGGVQYNNRTHSVNVRAAYFNRRITDIIIFKGLPTPPYGKYENADEQKDQGVELEASYRPANKWSITANYTYLDGKIETKAAGKDTSFFNLYRRPKHAVNATVGYQATPKLFASVGFRWQSSRTDIYFNPATFASEQKQLKDYYNLDVYVEYKVLSKLKLFTDVRNITDVKYFDLFGYNSRRFNFMAGVSLYL